MIEIAIIGLLDVGSHVELDPDKVFVNRVPQGKEPPFVVIRRLPGLTYESKGNTSHIDQSRIQFMIVGSKMTVCSNIADDIRNDIDGVRNVSVSGEDILSIRYLSDSTDYNDDLDQHLLVVDYEVKIKK